MPIPVCSGSSGAVSATTQIEYLSLLLELPFNKIFVLWPGSAGEGQEQGSGLTLPQHGRLREDAVLSVGLSVPVQGDGGVTVSPTAMWERAGPWEAPVGARRGGGCQVGTPPAPCLGLPALAKA